MRWISVRGTNHLLISFSLAGKFTAYLTNCFFFLQCDSELLVLLHIQPVGTPQLADYILSDFFLRCCYVCADASSYEVKTAASVPTGMLCSGRWRSELMLKPAMTPVHTNTHMYLAIAVYHKLEATLDGLYIFKNAFMVTTVDKKKWALAWSSPVAAGKKTPKTVKKFSPGL